MAKEKDRFPYILTYTKRYVPGSSDLKIIGEDAISIEFKNGERADVSGIIDKKGKEILNQFGVRIETKSERDKYQVETCQKKIILTDPEVLPVKIRWVELDLYTSKGFGTTGTSERFLTFIKLNESGEIEKEAKKI